MKRLHPLQLVYDDVLDFHDKFKVPYPSDPQHLSVEDHNFRVSRLMEEVREYRDATTLADKQDALIDLIYIALGTGVFHGFHGMPEGWSRVHEANMTKELVASADLSRHGHRYDIVKPPGWVAPDHRDLVGESK